MNAKYTDSEGDAPITTSLRRLFHFDTHNKNVLAVKSTQVGDSDCTAKVF